MGKLLSLLARDENSCCSSQQKYDIFLDFESKYLLANILVDFKNITKYYCVEFIIIIVVRY